MASTTKPATSFPLPNPTKSYWQTPPHRLASHRTTPSLPPTSKYVIIGSGITGASIAYKLLQAEPSASITLLEARQAASGASGRNGGHCRAGDYLEFKTNVDKLGVEDALRVERLEETNVENVARFVKEHGIDCDLRGRETCDIFIDPKQWEEALAALKAREETGVPKMVEHKIWGQEDARKVLLTPEAIGAISFPAWVLSPYKLVCAILEMNIEKGVNLQTNTVALEVLQGPEEKWVVKTDRGEIEAENVILATNAYTAALYQPLADIIVPTRSQIAAVRPGSRIADKPALERTGAFYAANGFAYFQSRSDDVSGAGDFILGGGRSKGTNNERPVFDDTTIHPNISKFLVNSPVTFFGGEAWGEKGEVLQEWTGILGFAPDRHPIIGEAPGQKGLWICAAFHGHGMALTFESAEALVGLLRGREKEVDEWLPKCFKLSRFSVLD